MNRKITIIVFAVLIFSRLLLLGLPPLSDPSESRYATMAQDMVESNQWWSPPIWIEGKQIPFMGKPQLGFWLIGAAVKLFGANEWSVRLPAFVTGLLLVGIIYLVLRRYNGNYLAVASCLITLTSTCFYILAGVVLIDMALALFSMGAVFWYYAFLREENTMLKKVFSLLVFIFLGLGMITKGPIALVYFGVPVFFWTLLTCRWRSLKQHAWITGGIAFLAICIPDFLMLEKHMPGFSDYFFVHENFLRFTTADYGDLYSGSRHGLFLGAALLLTLVVCLPWILYPLCCWGVFLLQRIRTGEKDFWRGLFFAKPIKWLKGMKEIPDTEAELLLFPVGLIGLALFWSCASQVMLYYLILLTPLFGVWMANYLQREHVSLKTITSISSMLLVLYLTTYLPLSFIIERLKSSRQAVAVAMDLRSEQELRGNLTVVRRIPYSAYFYADRQLLLPHPAEKVVDSFRDFDERQNVYLLMRKYWKRIPQVIRRQLDTRKVGDWIVACPKKVSILGSKQ